MSNWFTESEAKPVSIPTPDPVPVAPPVAAASLEVAAEQELGVIIQRKGMRKAFALIVGGAALAMSVASTYYGVGHWPSWLTTAAAVSNPVFTFAYSVWVANIK